MTLPTQIVGLDVRDIRFPTSFSADGSDATHTDPDYSATYVTLLTDSSAFVGCGLTFTIGRGNELVRHAVDSMRFLVVNRFIEDIQDNMSGWVRDLSSESQLRWVGPEKGVIALATAAIVNAFWDLWGKMEEKPVWKLLADMTPEKIVSLVDFRYLDDCITKEEALDLLRSRVPQKKEREKKILEEGFPAYTTQVGWLGYPDEKIVELCKKFLQEGFTAFKVKVGTNLEDDKRRLRLIRETVGPKNLIMVDANQKWSVNEAIQWMEELVQFKLTWIEEPTSPDDILGHKKISQAMEKHGVGVATGEMCQNRVMFKQFLQSGAMQYCQIDSGRMAGLNEVLAVYLMAAKLACLSVRMLAGWGCAKWCSTYRYYTLQQVFDFIVLSGTTENRLIEYIDHLHEHFIHPPRMGQARYFPPLDVGYSTEMKAQSVKNFEYPRGAKWREYFATERYRDPSLEFKQL